MRDKKIAAIHTVNPRFFRSTDLVRDFWEEKACSAYYLTPQANRCLEMIGEGIVDAGHGRSWRITGDYGSGKSSFALFLAQAASGKDLGPRLRPAYSNLDFIRQKRFLLPILVTGRRAPIAESIALAIQNGLKKFAPKVLQGAFAKNLNTLITSSKSDSKASNTDEDLISLILELSGLIERETNFSGLLIIVDEMGKFLEFTAQHPDLGDIFILQQLGEIASRSGSSPIVVIGLLHQNFSAYASRLGLTTQKEWDKVAGRYEQLIFDHPIDQIAGLVALALGTDVEKLSPQTKSEAKQRMEAAIGLGWYGQAFGKAKLLELAPQLYPLDPLAFPVICRVFKLFGQNERSLFSFLHSSDGYAFSAFCQKPLSCGEFYGLPHFYSFIESNLSPNLSLQGYGETWGLVSFVVNSKGDENPIIAAIFRAIGIFNLLGANDLIPSIEAVSWLISSGGAKSRTNVKSSLKDLIDSDRSLFLRGAAGGLRFWPHTSVDLHLLQRKAKDAVPTVGDPSNHIQRLLNHRPVVARRHYIETGNMRAFQICYCRIEDLDKDIKIDFGDIDGIVLVPLVANEAEKREALKLAKGSALKKYSYVVIAVPRPISILEPYLLEFLRWDWIAKNTPDLNSDRLGREEVSRQRESSLQTVTNKVEMHFGVTRPIGKLDIRVFYLGVEIEIQEGRKFLELLSKAAKKTFYDEPRVFNEMLNRRKPSSAAMMAWGKAMEGLFKQPEALGFGLNMDLRPPEVALYMSIFQKSGVHRENRGKWALELPGEQDHCKLMPCFDVVRDMIPMGGNGRLKIPELYIALQQPPFGVRQGLIHFLLTTYVAIHKDDVALYENGTFLREIGAQEFARLIKAPDRFEIQHIGLNGLRREVFRRMSDILASVTRTAKEEPKGILSVVQPLCKFVAGLPQYTLHTARLDPRTLASRAVILNAREPAALLFTELPAAVGFRKAIIGKGEDLSAIEKVVKDIQECLIELQVAYEKLLSRIGENLLTSLGIDAKEDTDQHRLQLSERASGVMLHAGDLRLKGFCGRLQDGALNRLSWLESLGSFVQSKPPKSWSDQDEITYAWKVQEIVAQFLRVESIGHKNGNNPAFSMRIAITSGSGEEQTKVMHYSPQEEKEIERIRKNISAILKSGKRLALIATTKELWTAFEQNPQSQSND